MAINQYDIYWIDLEPTKGSEINKVRPCVVISPNEMNYNINTVVVAPLTTKSHKYPTRIEIELNGTVSWIVLDQIRSIDKTRLIRKAGELQIEDIIMVKNVIKEMLVD